MLFLPFFGWFSDELALAVADDELSGFERPISLVVDELLVFKDASESSDTLLLLLSKSGKQNSLSSFGNEVTSFSS